MRRFPSQTPPALALALLIALPVAGWAQSGTAAPPKTVAPVTRAEPPAGRPDQRIERIHVEDDNAKIDELRVGGETQRITVQPKSGMPAYEILPTDGKNSPPALTREGGARGNGERVWKVLSF